MKKEVLALEKTHWKEMKKVRSSIKRKKSEIKKINKKLKKERNPVKNTFKDLAVNDLHTEEMVHLEQERQAIRQISLVERSFFLSIASELHKLLIEEVELFNHGMNISKEALKVEKKIKDTNDIPWSVDEYLDDLISSGQGFIFITPSSSPRTSLKSWGGSMLSLASISDFSPQMHKTSKLQTKLSNINEKRDIERDVEKRIIEESNDDKWTNLVNEENSLIRDEV